MFSEVFRNKKVLVTGNTGFKGSWLSLWLVELGADVYGLSDTVPTNPSLFEAVNLEALVNHTMLDLGELDRVKELVSQIKPDFVFHLAAQAIVSLSHQDPLKTLRTNVMGTAHVLEALKDLEQECTAVFITSDKCYENVEWVWGYKETDPLGGKDIYSASKAAAEIIFHAYKRSFFQESAIRLATARAGNVIGGGDWAMDRIVPDAMRSWNQSKPVIIRSPGATRPWQHVLEPLSGYLRLAQSLRESPNLHGESFNFGPPAGQNATVSHILEDLAAVWGWNPPRDSYEAIGETLFPEAGLLKLNCDKALSRLSWNPTLSYEEVIDYVGSWYSHFYTKKADLLKFTQAQIQSYIQKAKLRNALWAQ
jgi:CDP-glucose 4,6-dehydratase